MNERHSESDEEKSYEENQILLSRSYFNPRFFPSAEAQQTGKIIRIGFLDASTASG